MTGGWWKAPRELLAMLERGDITPTEYTLLHVVGGAGADREQGFPATTSRLARLLGVGEKTARATLAQLKEQGLISYELKQGQRRPFVIRLRKSLRNQETEVTSEVTSPQPPPATSPHAAPAQRSRPAPTSELTSPPMRQETERTTQDVISAYLSGGGSLERSDWRSALERNATSLLRKGIPVELVLAAARQLGRERAFPGYLAQRVAQLRESGGPCRWAGMARDGLTASQLGECSCRKCGAWLAASQPVQEGEAA